MKSQTLALKAAKASVKKAAKRSQMIFRNRILLMIVSITCMCVCMYVCMYVCML